MTLNRYLLILLVSLASASCADRLETPPGVVNGKTYEASFADETSRAQLDDSHLLYWMPEDRISVFTDKTNQKYRFTGTAGAVRGSFVKDDVTVATEAFEKTYAVYPYDEGIVCESEGIFSVVIPSVQAYAAHSFDPEANVMLAVTQDIEDISLRFRNACGYIRIQLYGLDVVKSITLKGNDGEVICGGAEMTPGEFNNPELTMTGSDTGITIDCGDGVALGGDKEHPTEFWFALAPTVFTKGFTFEIVNSYDQVVTKKVSSKVTVSRNLVKTVSPIKTSGSVEATFSEFYLTDGQNIYRPFETTDSCHIRVQVPGGTNLKGLTTVFAHNGVSVKVGGVEQVSGETVNSFEDFTKPVKYELTSASGNTREFTVVMFDLPLVIMETPEHKPITSKEIWTEGCSFIIRNTDGTVLDCGATSLKGRGNWTWNNDPKKPFAVKFESKPKSDILGMPTGKRWCLLNNMSMFSNAVGFKLASMSESQKWAPRSTEVDVIFNGTHIGMYQFTEQIKIDKNRVNITEISPTDVEGDAVTGGYVLTYDNTFDEPYKFRSQYFNMPVMFKIPDEDVPAAQMNYVKNYINTFEASLSDAARLSSREYLEYIDIDSFIDVWYVEELAGDTAQDFGVPRSAYFTKDRCGLLMAGPVWDFNSSTFTRKVIQYDKKQYYGKLFEDPYFVARVKEKWPDFRKRIEGSGSGDGILDYIDFYYNMVARAGQRDVSMWPKYYSGTDRQAVKVRYQEIKSGITPKIDYLEAWINALKVDYDKKPGSSEDFSQQTDRSADFNFGF